ncbi:hypothetical protein NRK67_13190 [Fusobacteria bacterium ZRK30]|nr:hypothetical protein NRK67_13190 [Fusobacteria bacterium ZRK30]
MKKILKSVLIFLILILSGCSTTFKEYSFDDQPISYTPNKEYEKYIYIYTEGSWINMMKRLLYHM